MGKSKLGKLSKIEKRIMTDCIFCKIINHEIPADFVYEDKDIVAFYDIKPKAKTHILIVTRKHIDSINEIEEADTELIGRLFLVAKKIAKEEGISESGYRLVFNVGRGAGQAVFHLHLHLLGGANLPTFD